jgi:hypothetical protein
MEAGQSAPASSATFKRRRDFLQQAKRKRNMKPSNRVLERLEFFPARLAQSDSSILTIALPRIADQ